MVALTHCELLLEIQQILKASRRASPWAPQVCLRCCRADQDGVTIAIYVSKVGSWCPCQPVGGEYILPTILC